MTVVDELVAPGEDPWGDPWDDPAALIKAQISAAVAEAFSLVTRLGQEQRETLYAMSMSKIGGCTAQAAHRIAGTPPSDPHRAVEGENRQANLGTWAHEGFLPVLAKVLGGGAATEVKIIMRAGDDQVPGSADLIWPAGKMIIDLKTLHPAKGTRVGTLGAYRSHRLQVGGYALGAVQNGYDIQWVVWIYMDRESGQEWVVVEEWTDAYALEVLERMWLLQELAKDPDSAPREGPLIECAGCPWHVRCLGEDTPPPGRRDPLPVHDDPETAEIMLDYQRARSAVTDLEKQKEFLRFLIERREMGRYGALEWEITDPEGFVPDKDAAVAWMEERGYPVPQRPKTGTFQLRVARDPAKKKPRKRPAVPPRKD